MQSFLWQENLMLVSFLAQGCTRTVRAASSSGELVVKAAKLAGTDVTSSTPTFNVVEEKCVS